MLVPVDLVVRHRREGGPAVGRGEQLLIPDIDGVLVGRVDADGLVVATLAVALAGGVGGIRSRGDLGPGGVGGVGIIRPEDLCRRGRARLQVGVDGVGIGGLRLRERDVTVRRDIAVEDIGRERGAGVGGAHEPAAVLGRVHRRAGRGVEVEVGDVAVQDPGAIVEGGRVAAEMGAAVDRFVQAVAGGHQQDAGGGHHHADDRQVGEDAAGIQHRPGVAAVQGLVDPNSLAEDPAAVEVVARPGVHRGGGRRIDDHRAHRQRRQVIRLGFPRGARVGALPDATVVGRDVDRAVRPAARIDRDVDHLTGVGPRTLEVLVGVDPQRLRPDLGPLDPGHTGHEEGDHLVRPRRGAGGWGRDGRRDPHLLLVGDALLIEVRARCP